MNDEHAASTFVLLCAAIYLLPLLVAGFFDRYLIPVIPFLAAVAIPRSGPPIAAKSVRLGFCWAGLLLGVLSVFAVCGTRDYLAWNRVRWAALRELMENRHAKPEEIDGGFEFNGYYLYDPDYKQDLHKSWWWVKNDTYLVAFGGVPGYHVIKAYSYRQWMPPRSAQVVVLQKDAVESANASGVDRASEDVSGNVNKPR